MALEKGKGMMLLRWALWAGGEAELVGNCPSAAADIRGEQESGLQGPGVPYNVPSAANVPPHFRNCYCSPFLLEPKSLF